jgi:hypothetical protein
MAEGEIVRLINQTENESTNMKIHNNFVIHFHKMNPAHFSQLFAKYFSYPSTLRNSTFKEKPGR